jgi:hypothetical protein
MESETVRVHAVLTAPSREEVRSFLHTAVRFAAVGLVLWAAVYAASEGLVYKYGDRNRFYMVKTAPRAEYDHVILGASHAAVFDYQDMNERLESLTGSKILNLSIVGAGVTVNRLVLDYFLLAHRTRTIVYVLDSFAFYSPAWNEERLSDARLFQRAPVDPALARLLLRSGVSPSVTLDYVTGFSKINNADRFKPDRPDDAARFNRTYRFVDQIDRQRIAYLYPGQLDAQALAYRDRYLSELEALIRDSKSKDIRMILLRPPLPDRTRRKIPGEAQFDEALQKVVAGTGAELWDFSQVSNDERFFFDTDHLNRTGVLHLFETHVKDIL